MKKPMQRSTAQRREIQRIFEELDRPLSPSEVLEEARRTTVNIGIATIYRNVKSLMESNWLVPVAIPGETDRYELGGKKHHLHFRCRVCTRVFDAPCRSCASLNKLAPSGFTLEDHEIVLHGLCAACKARGKKSIKASRR